MRNWRIWQKVNFWNSLLRNETQKYYFNKQMSLVKFGLMGDDLIVWPLNECRTNLWALPVDIILRNYVLIDQGVELCNVILSFQFGDQVRRGSLM